MGIYKPNTREGSIIPLSKESQERGLKFNRAQIGTATNPEGIPFAEQSKEVAAMKYAVGSTTNPLSIKFAQEAKVYIAGSKRFGFAMLYYDPVRTNEPGCSQRYLYRLKASIYEDLTDYDFEIRWFIGKWKRFQFWKKDTSGTIDVYHRKTTLGYGATGDLGAGTVNAYEFFGGENNGKTLDVSFINIDQNKDDFEFYEWPCIGVEFINHKTSTKVQTDFVADIYLNRYEETIPFFDPAGG